MRNLIWLFSGWPSSGIIVFVPHFRRFPLPLSLEIGKIYLTPIFVNGAEPKPRYYLARMVLLWILFFVLFGDGDYATANAVAFRKSRYSSTCRTPNGRLQQGTDDYYYGADIDSASFPVVPLW
jgi:hypothetical protein